MDDTIWTLTKLPEKNPTDLRAQIVPTEHNFLKGCPGRCEYADEMLGSMKL